MNRRSFFRACAGAAVAAPLASLAPAIASPFTFPAHAVIPRYTHQTYGLGFKIARENLSPGDMEKIAKLIAPEAREFNNAVMLRAFTSPRPHYSLNPR